MEKDSKEKNNNTMTDVECATTIEDFVNSGRTGRRNAVPDILDSKHGTVSTSDLPFEMEKLNCTDKEASAGSSGQNSKTGQSGQNS